jgi:hypothetical protein
VSCFEVRLTIADAIARLNRATAFRELLGPPTVSPKSTHSPTDEAREAFTLMHAEKTNFTIARMARLLEVSQSGFYARLGREPSVRALRAERIEAKIAWFHGESDVVSGAPRILADLREDGEVISRRP